MKEKCKLLIDFCTYEAAKYAVLNYHYSKKMPVGKLFKLGVWENNIWKGCIIFSYAVGSKSSKSLDLKNQELCELVRVALKTHITEVTKMIAIAIKILKKKCPNLKCIVSFADPLQKHVGKIYQAGNWIYIGKSSTTLFYKFPDGNLVHSRTANQNNKHFGRKVKNIDITNAIKVKSPGKYKYIYPLTKEMREKIIKLSKPYPKKESANVV